MSLLHSCAVPAGPPENFVLMNVTDTTVALSFSPPNSSGIPPFSGYHIVTTPLTQSDTYSDKYVTTVSVLIAGLLPNTNYNVTVAAVSYDDNTDVVEGEVSNAITFMTKLGGKNDPGIIIIHITQWSLIWAH